MIKIDRGTSRLASALLGTVSLTTLVMFQPALVREALAQDAVFADAEVLETITVVPDQPDRFDKHQGAADRAASIYISPEDIERTDPQTLRDLFAGEPSISVGGGIPIAQKVFVNGIEDTNLAVTIDGVQQGNRVFHHATTNYIDPSMLKAVRVDPGVAPADAGFAALGGAIVYETVDARDMLIGDRPIGAYAKLSYETNGETFTETASGYARHTGFEVLGYGRLAKGDDYKNGDGWTVPGTAADFSALLAKGAYEADNGYRAEVTAQRITDNALRPWRANFAGLNGAYDLRVYDTTRENYSFNVDSETVEGWWNPVVTLGYSTNDFKVPDPYSSEGDGSTLTAKAENIFAFNDTDTVAVGVDFNDVKGNYFDPAESYKEEVSNFGFYAQARLEPLERLTLSFGGRIDTNHFTGKDGTTLDNTGLSGNVFAEYALSDAWSVNAGYSHVFGGIKLEETFQYWRTWNYAGLDPVESDNVTGGVKFQHNGWYAEGNLFNTKFRNFRNGDQNMDFRSYGFNVAGGYNWGNGFARLAYSDTRISVSGLMLESYYLLDIGAAVGQIITGEITHTFTDYGITLGATVDAALEFDGYVAAGYDTLDPYAIFNAYAEYTPEDLDFFTLRLEARNIFDETYTDRATYGQEYDEVTPLYQPGRSFYVMARVRY